MKKIVSAALILALAALPAHANTERKRNAEKPDYDAYKKELALEMVLIPEAPLEVGKPVNVLAKLVDKQSGRAVPESWLKLVHEHKIHLLVIDPTLTDYQHIHPSTTATDGLYTFTFTPKRAGGYRAWADVTATDNKHQFVMADLGNLRGSSIDKKESFETQVDGYHFTLKFDDAPRLKGESMGTISITDSSGAPVTGLEPIMGTFGHIVGFHDDLRTVVHIHPMGTEPSSASARGGPQLAFHIKPTEPGFVKLFAQVKINGKEVFAPFGFTVSGKKVKGFGFDKIGDVF